MPRYAVIDDTHPDIVYNGAWTALTTPLNPNAPEFNHTVHATNDPNATITYNFYGTILNFYGSINAPGIFGYPNASYTIQPDVVPIKHFNQSGTVPSIPASALNVSTSHMEMFRSGKFAEGNYTMTVKADGVSAGGPTFYFDFLTVQCGDSIYVDMVILDDNDQQWNYEGAWITGNKTGGYRNTIHETPEDGGKTTLGFHGTEIAVYGTLQGPYEADTPIGYFQINGGETHTVLAGNITNELLLPNGTEMANQRIWRTTGLPDVGQRQHSITISVPSATNTSAASSISTTTTIASSSITPAPTASPWFLDYVVYGPSYALTPRATATEPASTSSSPPPAGAIAGGVIGGLLGFLLLIIGFLLWRHQRRAKAAAAAEVKDEFKTNYGSTISATSRPTLAGRRSSIHKGGTPGAGGYGGGAPAGGVNGLEGPVLDISASSPLAIVSGHVGTSTMTGPGTADSAYETDYTYARRPVPRPVREMDGGVRLASGSDIDSEVVEVLPPSYARYGDNETSP